MSDSITQEQSQTTQETPQETPKQTPETLPDTSKQSKHKKFSLPGINVFKIIPMVRHYGIPIAVNLVILLVVCILFLFQRHWIQGGNQVVVNMVEEKLRETIKKSLDEGITKVTRQEELKENTLSDKNNKEKRTPLKNGHDTIPADNSKFIIEANRVYEQGDYKKAATLYENGLDKSMPFLNEDFVMYQLGDCYLRSEKYDEALHVFQTLNSDYINSPYRIKSLLKTGECYAAVGELKKARKTLYTLIAQEGKCRSEDDRSAVVDSYFKIADYYREEAQRLRETTVTGPSSSSQSLALK